MNRRRSLCMVLLSTLMGFTAVSRAEDNLLAHRLFKQGDYARAGEIFTDPAWKGIALYRSSQWWRAAEAFVRANDAPSAYNLGNCYVKLGYYALALDAYVRALSMDPDLDDARHNADIMRKLLATEQDEQQRGGQQPVGEEIEQLDTQDQRKDPGEGSGGQEQSQNGDTGLQEQTQTGEQILAPRQNAQAGKGGEARDQEHSPDGEQGSGALNGETSEELPTSRPSGGSESSQPADDSQAAGLRTALETEQATTQWLNQINHDAPQFLKQRIQLELKRRQAAGQTAPEGGSSW